MNDLKLSVIVPVYNTEKFLNNCISSVVSYKGKDIEILLINDGSPDNSDRICREWERKDSRIRYILKKNGGCSQTRNLGLKEAKGEYVWFIDSDDYIEKNAIEKLLKEINRNPKLDLILFGLNQMSFSGKLEEKKIPKNIEKFEKIYEQENIFNGVVNKIYCKKKIEGIFFPENSHMGEDLAFNFKVMHYIKKILILKDCLYYVVLHNESVSKNIDKRKEIFFSFDDIFKFYREKNIFFQYEKILKDYYEKNAIFYPYNLILSSNLERKEKLKKIKELNFELNKRRNIFNTRFLIAQTYYYLKYKLDFLRPYYREIKNRMYANQSKGKKL